MKTCFYRALCVVLTVLPVSAFAYTFDVDKHLEEGVQVDYVTHDIDDTMSSVTLNNFGKEPVQCTGVFRNGPESPRTRRILVQPLRSAELSMKFTRSILRMQLDLTCKPA